MNNSETNADRRGGGDKERTDAFRYAPGYGIYVIALVGLIGIAIVVFDIGGVRRGGDAIWLMVTGTFTLLFGLCLSWFAWRRPVLMIVGPDGLHLTLSFAQPVPWAEILRIRCVRWHISWVQKMITFSVDLIQGAQPRYKRSLLTIPVLDGWMARKFGLRIPIQNMDADARTVLASIERFKPVAR